MSKCPRCGTDGAYVGFSSVECLLKSCLHYSESHLSTTYIPPKVPPPEYGMRVGGAFYCGKCGALEGSRHSDTCPTRTSIKMDPPAGNPLRGLQEKLNVAMRERRDRVESELYCDPPYLGRNVTGGLGYYINKKAQQEIRHR